MLHDGVDALVVDPGHAEPVLAALSKSSLRLRGILVTHHHADHVGGLAQLRPHCHGPVYGPAHETIDGLDERLDDGAVLELLGRRFEVLEVPGHTAGHIAYFSPLSAAGAEPLLFCGDTLFSGGCGRLFEGTPGQLYHSLMRLATLPGETRVCCAHEYTLSNLRFARTIEPANEALRRYESWCQTQRQQNQPTLPSTVALEREINPFMRCAERAVAVAVPAVDAQDPIAVFAALRQWKNEFR